MPYSPQERADVRLYLGWPAAFYAKSDSLEQAMDNISQSRPEDLANAQALVVEIAAHDAKLVARLDASTWATKTGSIEQRAEYAHEAMNNRGRTLTHRLAAIHGVAIQSDYFGQKTAPYIGPRAGNAGSYELVEG